MQHREQLFINNATSILETAKEQLSRRVFDKVLETEDLIADVEQLLASFIDLEDKLFKRRAAKVLKIYNEMNLNQIQREMVTGEPFFQGDSESLFEDNKLIQSSITTRKQQKPAKQLNKRSVIPSTTIPSPSSPPPRLTLKSSSSSTSVRDIKQFAEILADLEKDTIPPAHRNFETTANTETTSGLNFCETNKTLNRLVRKFVSSSVVNLSRRNITSGRDRVT